MRELRAQLQISICEAPPGHFTRERDSLSRDPRNPNVILLPDSEAEAAAVQRLEDCGFARAGTKLVMRKENQIARFFAFEYPRLKAEWKVTLSAQAEKFSHEVQPLAPAIDIVASGRELVRATLLAHLAEWRNNCHR